MEELRSINIPGTYNIQNICLSSFFVFLFFVKFLLNRYITPEGNIRVQIVCVVMCSRICAKVFCFCLLYLGFEQTLHNKRYMLNTFSPPLRPHYRLSSSSPHPIHLTTFSSSSTDPLTEGKAYKYSRANLFLSSTSTLKESHLDSGIGNLSMLGNTFRIQLFR